MTDTGQVPGEGLPENAGMVEQPGVPAQGAYTYLEPSGHTSEEDDLLLMPGAQGAWSEHQHTAPAPAPVHHGVPAADQYAPAPAPVQHAVPAGVPQHGSGEYLMDPQAGYDYAHAAHQGEGAAAFQEPAPGFTRVATAEDSALHALDGTPAPAEQQAHQLSAEPLVQVQGTMSVVPGIAPGPPVQEPAPDAAFAPQAAGQEQGAFPDAPAQGAAPVAGQPPAFEAEQPAPGEAFAAAPEQAAPAEAFAAAPAAHETGAHEAGGRDSGSVDLGAVRTPSAATSAMPTPPPARRPLHMGPPVPEANSGVVRSLADRGPAGTPPHPMTVRTAPAPQHTGVEYLDVAREATAEELPGPQLGEIPPQAGAPWDPQPPQQEAPAAETVVPQSAAEPQAAPEAAVPAPREGDPQPVQAPEAEAPVAAEAPQAAAPEAAPAPVETAPQPEAVVPAEAPGAPEPLAPAADAPEAVADPAAEALARTPAEPVEAQSAPAEAPEPVQQPQAEAPQAVEPAAPAETAPSPDPVTPEAPEAPEAQAPDAQPVAAEAPQAPAREAAAPAAPAPEAAAGPVETVPQPEPVAPAEAPGAPEPLAPAADAPEAADPAADAPAAPVAEPLAEAPAADAAPEQEDAPAAGSAPAPEAVTPPAPGYDDAEREAVLRVMRERRDIRNGFRSDPIPHEVLLRVLEAAHTAPSVGHSQPWDFVVIRSAETRRTMHELAQRQREAYAKSLPKGRAKQFKELKIEAILDTPVNIVVTADPTRGGRHTLGRHTQPQMAPYSSALAVENLWLAARAEGLGVGWVSFFDEREMVRTLGLPDHLEVVAYLCVGYVDEFPEEPELMQAGWSKRRPLSWVVHEETYGRRALPGEEPHDLLQETVTNIRPLDAKALGEAWERQKRMTKPSGALGMLEIISAQLSGLSRMCPPPVPEPAAVAIFAGDHGVHAQGVTAWPQEVTGQMVANFLGGGAVCNAFANQVGAEVCVIDVGVASDLPATPGLLPRKVRAGTADFTTGPALTRDEVFAAIEVGIETARDLVAAGNKALLTGEMGIANTTASAALISVYTGADPAEITGRGTGINDAMHARKVDVVRRALELHRPDPADPVGVLAAVGGLEHCALVGLILGGASLRTPVVLDGVSTGAAALVARAIAPEALAACIAGHRSAEPGHVAALGKLGLRPLVDLDLRLGEGTGALLALPIVQSAARAMHEVATFDSAGVTEK
ncbi:nicotinate-nucleotide--dimethylbenzimidazole phosphoribosyltransferase [Streptomyces zhihengii]|uniref:nicotinate-nucleotide--dimethylbenzimidazole phosphoribosyltransferase n=1 Tax=Streptomyces zhihengii TaxID=1818004 RepID=UPI00363AA622